MEPISLSIKTPTLPPSPNTIYRRDITEVKTEVDASSYQFLCLAQRAIAFTHQALPAGSSNQVEHLIQGNRSGSAADPKVMSLDSAIWNAVGKMCKKNNPHGPLPWGESAEIDFVNTAAIVGGVGIYYGGGNCTTHALVAACFLIANAPAGTKIMLCESIDRSHGFLLVQSADGALVVCDPHPAQHAQAVQPQHFHLKENDIQPNRGRGWPTGLAYTVQETDRQRDVIAEFFTGRMNLTKEEINNVLSTLPRRDALPGYSPGMIKTQIKLHKIHSDKVPRGSGLFEDRHCTHHKFDHEYVTNSCQGSQKFSEFCRELSISAQVTIPHYLVDERYGNIKIHPELGLARKIGRDDFSMLPSFDYDTSWSECHLF